MKRILSLFLVLCLLLGCLPKAAAEQTDGSFVLTVVTQEAVVIAPQRVVYAPGETVADALGHSGHAFSGLGIGFITAVDDVADNYSLFYDQGGYDLAVPAAQITALCLTANAEAYSEDLLQLIRTMVSYTEDESGVQSYPAAQQAYADALAGLYPAADCEALEAALKRAMGDFAAYLAGEKVTVTLAVEQDGAPVAVDVTMTGEFGNVYTARQADSIAVIPGSYSFDLSDGGRNHVRGQLYVTQPQTLAATLPSAPWVADIDLGIANGDKWEAVPRQDGAYLVPDYAGESLYPYLVPAEGIDPTQIRVYAADKPTQSTYARTWLSHSTVLTKAQEANSLRGTTVQLEARKADGDLEQYQTYELTVRRMPTLASLCIVAEGTTLPLDFRRDTQTYDLTTVSDRLTVQAAALCPETTVTVNGDSRMNVPADDLTVTASYGGLSRDYTIHVTRRTPATVYLSHTPDVSVELTNAAGSVIAPVAENIYGDGLGNSKGNPPIFTPAAVTTYRVIPGEVYTYVSTRDQWFHSTADFIAVDGMTVMVTDPDTTPALSAMELRPAGKAPAFPMEAFSPALHEYHIAVGSNQTTLGIVAEFDADCTIHYPDFRFWDEKNNKPRTTSPGSGVYRAVNNALGASGYGTTLRVELTTAPGQYHDYFVYVQRLLQINDLKLSVGGDALPLSFDRDCLAYTVEVGQSRTELDMDLTLFANANGNDNAFTVTAACSGASASVDYAELAVNEPQRLTLPLDTSLAEETVTLTVEREGAVSQTYSILLKKLPPVSVAFVTEPEDAVVFLTDERSDSRVFPQDGRFTLDLNAPYHYVVSRCGYLAQENSFFAGASEVFVRLTAAPGSERVDILREDDYPSFRGNDENNGLTAAPTPIAAEDAVLSWAHQLGEGYSSGATGSPILVGGYLYSYANETIFKVDKTTGEVVLAMPMDHASSFAITPPAYGEGMIFVALSDGTVQAFDAQTLESLWVYRDARKGQPNCPIAYHDGYLYTGFWNSEVRSANFVCLSVTDEQPEAQKETKLPTWTYTHNGFYWAGAYVCDDFLLVTTDDGADGYVKGHGSLLSLDPRTGALLDERVVSGVGDLRSSVCYDTVTDAYYFTSKGGDLYQARMNADGTIASIRALHLSNGSSNALTPPMSTSTPTVWNGRAYVGVSGTAQFGAYSGHNMTVIDLEAWKIAYSIPTQGYPQTSALLTTAYDDAYVYFFDNYTPGKLRMLKDRPGQTAADPAFLTTETYTVSGEEKTAQTAYVLFTPDGAQAQYAICSPIVDRDGSIYFKNDSAYLMCLSSRITALEVTQQPDKRIYREGEVFDPTGLRVKAIRANGVETDVTDRLCWSTDPLTSDDTELTLTYSLGSYEKMYRNVEDVPGCPYDVPTADLTLVILEKDAPLPTEPTDETTEPSTEPSESSEETTEPSDETTEPTESSDETTEPSTDPIEPPEMECDGGILCPSRNFLDIPVKTWYHLSVDYVISRGLFNGISEDLFKPNATMTRAMLVTVLWRYAGRPEAGEAPFTDVAANQWYTEAVAWASGSGIVNGVSSDRFSPNARITREQMATILFRFSGEAAAEADLSEFPDHETISPWARTAMEWTVSRGIITGSDGKLLPQNSATRAQVAAMLMRFLK